MTHYPLAIKKLIDLLVRLPGLGPKAAERIIFYLLKQNSNYTDELIAAIQSIKREIKICDTCYNIGTRIPCSICSDSRRDATTICVVAEPQDIFVIEKIGEYKGLYHVLGGVLNPVEGTTPDAIKIRELLQRVAAPKNKIKEVILATNPDLEGESTALYITRKLKELQIKTTRLAKGLPMGSTIEYADEVTLSSAFKGRQEV